MGTLIALVGFWLALNAQLGRSQETTCWSGKGATVFNTCFFDITCAPVSFITAGFVIPPPELYTNNCPALDYTCSTTTIPSPDTFEVGLYYVDVTCTSGLAAPTTPQVVSTTLATAPTLNIPTPTPTPLPTSTVVLSTAPTLSITFPTISSASVVIPSPSIPSSPTSSSTHSPSSTVVASSQPNLSSSVLNLPSTTVSIYSALPIYTGGYLFRNTCAVPEFTLLPGPKPTILIWAPFVGCVNDKPDCCPWPVVTIISVTTATISVIAPSTSTVSLSQTATFSSGSLSGSISVISSHAPPSPGTSLRPSQSSTSTSASALIRAIFPVAASGAQATLSICPQDYHRVSSSCCPIGYTLYTSAIAGITPCYSPLSSTLSVTPPPGTTLDPTIVSAGTSISDSTGAVSPSTTLSTTVSAPQTSISVINNVYLADPFPVQPPAGPSVSRGDIAAIVLSCLGGAAATLASWWWWRRRRASSGFQKHGYTIAWISPLEIDALAARNMLDNAHDAVEFPASRGVDHIYTVGDINGHNVVIATFPSGHSTGPGAAGDLARDIIAKFPDILFTLVVGVAGGIPDFSQSTPRDIRRGDVLVAQGEEGGPAIISYSLGTETATHLVPTKTTVKVFGSVIGIMKRAGIDQWNLTSPNSFRQYYHSLLDKDARKNTTFQDPGQARDILLTGPQGFNGGIPNPLPARPQSLRNYDRIQAGSQAGSSSNTQNPSAIPRVPRADNERVKVWYGRLGSGEDLRDNPQRRRQLKQDYDIIGLETGANSVMDVLERVGVIRGVCDYADGQQAREWQPFAAATAAAFAKALLYTIKPDKKLNRTKEQRNQPDRDEEKDSPTVEVVLLPTPKISLKFSLRSLLDIFKKPR